MGNFYTNITTLGPTQDELAVTLARYDRYAFITPTRDGISVIFDRASETGNPAELGDLSITLSVEFACPVLAVGVYDDDVLLLALYDKGEQLGEYNSEGGSTLRARTLARVFRRSSRKVFVWLLLRSPRVPLFIFETLRHRLLLAALGQPAWACATGYNYIKNNKELPPGLDEELVHVEGTVP